MSIRANKWRSRLNSTAIFSRIGWNLLYYLGRCFSFFQWAPFKQEEDFIPNEVPNVNSSQMYFYLTRASSRQAKGAVLVIGANKTNQMDCERWDEYVGKQNSDWFELPTYITRNFSFKFNSCHDEETVKHLFNEVFERYQAYYNQYKDSLSPQGYDCIITDRVTTHCLVIDNPFSQIMVPEGNSPSEIHQNWSAFRNDLFDKNKPHHKGALNQSMFCLLFLNLLTRIKTGGSLILDTSYLASCHVDLLKKFFKGAVPFDYTASDKSCLGYQLAYSFDQYAAPRFLEFTGRTNKMPNFKAIQQQLGEMTLNHVTFDAHLSYPRVQEMSVSIL